MQVVGKPDEVPPAAAEDAFAIVQTGEARLYGNIILKKGVIGP